MKPTLLTTAAFLLLSMAIFAQGERNIWYFGNHAGLDFTSGDPVALRNSAMSTLDNSTSVADESGNLLFYSNGEKIWNRFHMVMPNGYNLMGDTTSTNAALGIKQPGHENQYYLFTNDKFAGPSGLRYSVIDLNMDGGTGDITDLKNIPILAPNTEKTLAIFHKNGSDIWIIAHEWDSDAFRAYLLTSDGLDMSPVISHAGSFHTGGTNGNYNAMGQIAASPDGTKIALAIYDLQRYELFDFNSETGEISNPIVINGYPNAWGVEFSPDGKKLYTTQWKFAFIHQFDLTSNDPLTINNSEVVVGEVSTDHYLYKAGFLQLGPDDKIYIAKWESNNLAVITTPDNSGIQCGFQDVGVILADNDTCYSGLPTFMKSNPDTGIVVPDDPSELSLTLFPNPVHDHFSLQIGTPSEGPLKVELLNSAGQWVAVLFSGDIPAGTNTIPFYVNGNSPLSVSAGTYFVRITFNGQRFLKKITILITQ